MKYIVEHNVRNQCYEIYKIYDRCPIKGTESVRILLISEDEMDKVIDNIIFNREL